MECYPELKINEPSSHEETWRKLKCMFLRKKRQSETAPYSWQFQLYDILEKGRTTGDSKRISGETRGWGSSGVGMLVEHRGTLGQWVYPVWYYNGTRVVHLSKPREWTASRVNANVTMDFEWSWQINVGSLTIRNVPLSFEKITWFVFAFQQFLLLCVHIQHLICQKF